MKKMLILMLAAMILISVSLAACHPEKEENKSTESTEISTENDDEGELPIATVTSGENADASANGDSSDSNSGSNSGNNYGYNSGSDSGNNSGISSGSSSDSKSSDPTKSSATESKKEDEKTEPTIPDFTTDYGENELPFIPA